LHYPDNYIAGEGFFVSHSHLPLSLAWEAFREKNGAYSIEFLRTAIQTYRSGKPPEHDPVIGCTILANPFFFKRSDWIPAPSNWSRSIVQGKGYETNEAIGAELWAKVKHRFYTNDLSKPMVLEGGAFHQAEEVARYGAEFLIRARLGQGAFRVLVTEAYTRRCAITGERTLSVLDAAHIKPFGMAGPHQTTNGFTTAFRSSQTVLSLLHDSNSWA
jgi:putative restriction endonuclease